MKWAQLRKRWEIFVAHVSLVDEAVAFPLSDGAGVILSTARSLTSTSVHELADLMSQAGGAILRKLVQRK